MLGLILIVLFVFVLLGALPTRPYSRNWGYYPSSTPGLVAVVLLVMLVLQRV